FATLGGLASRNQAKAVLAAGLGLGIAMIGVDGQTGVPRFSFGEVHLYDGIHFLTAIVGLFALSEVFLFIEHRGQGGDENRSEKLKLGRILPPMKMLKDTSGAMARSTVLGFIAGVLPGAGASLGSFMAYALEKKVSDKKRTFGTGDPRGVAAPEAANNASAGGAMVPMLALGVPGSGTTAVLLAMLMALNITPGPLLFQKNPDVVWGLIAALFIGNVMLLLLNLPMVGLFVRVLMVPSKYLLPAVAMLSFVGIYGVSGSIFDLEVMILFGVLGWALRKLDVPLVPVVLGVLLGNQMEVNLRREMTISDGNWFSLIDSPLSIALWTVAIIGFLLPIIVGRYFRPKMADSDEMEIANPD
ncbi:MAG: tripartite tricarboxylate transporter permease, partial [Alphaproteobacteria bacterium]|nr:tripartite tricarboxylate transporter permease [Alphaproteobacteria bacterium]